MLSFYSASVRIANSERAVDECMDIAFGGNMPDDCGVIIINAAIGHKLDVVAAAIRKYTDKACILGTSCGGVIGREGVGEALSNLAIMAVCGPPEEYACCTVDGIVGSNSYEKGRALADCLKEKLPGASIAYLICPGLDIAADRVLDAFDEVFGQDILIFGGTSADNYKAIATYQYLDGTFTEHGAWLLGMADPTLGAVAKASHGFCAYGEPMVVTKSSGNTVEEIDGVPAWQAYSDRLGAIADNDSALSVIAAGGLASKLPDDVAAEYGNSHILRGALQGRDAGVMYMSVTVQPGQKYWLTTRDEDLIFSEQEKALAYLRSKLQDKRPVAIFQADCLARGRTLFNKVVKDELIGMMQDSLTSEGQVPPWLGMYGFGEFCPLMGKNDFHTYTTSLLVLYR